MDDNETTSTEITSLFNHEMSSLDILQDWQEMSDEDKVHAFLSLTREQGEEVFKALSTEEQYKLISGLPSYEKRYWLRALPLDDLTDVIQRGSAEEHAEFLSLLDPNTVGEVKGLLAYAEDDAGGLMNPRFIRIRPDITVDVAIRYVRTQARRTDIHIGYAYVLDAQQRLQGVVRYKDLISADPSSLVLEIMQKDVTFVRDSLDQEEVSRTLRQSGLTAVPVVDEEGHMKGVVTLDDIVDVVQEEATEDIQKMGAVEALDLPYMTIGFWSMIKKRAGWLCVLFLGELLTATAMSRYEDELQKALVLALFIPLIISSGGNSGSQAASLIIRALALKEISLRDWWKVFLRELMSGLTLGFILGVIGLLRIILWPSTEATYGSHYLMLSVTVACSLVGVVLWGSLAGSMLPFALRRLGFDPATASAPFVATLVDVTGLVIYFTCASIFLSGTLLP